MNDEYLEPTSKGRVGVALVTLAGIVAALVLYRYSGILVTQSVPLTLCDELAAYRRLMQVFALALFVPGLWLALYGRRILRSGQSPPPGAWVLHRVLIKRGAHVRRVSLLLMALGVGIMALPFYFWSDLSRGDDTDVQCVP